MRAAQVIAPTGPADVVVREVDEPTPQPGQVLVEVHAVGVSFPDLLMSKGQYQIAPEPPFTLGVDLAGVVRDPGGSALTVGQRVAAVGLSGGAAEVALTLPDFTFALPDEMTYEQGAALPMNYLTAEFTLNLRAGLRKDETVLVHGAAGGLGTATIQVARGMGARVIAVVSTEAKAQVALAAGAEQAVLVEGFKDRVLELTEGRGVDVVVDIVGGDLFTDSLRCLAPLGRLMVLGFASGQGIPQVKVNRLLLTNTDVRGVGWGEYAMRRPGFMQTQWASLVPMIRSGVVRPLVGETYALEEFGAALVDMDERRATGKLVARVRAAR